MREAILAHLPPVSLTLGIQNPGAIEGKALTVLRRMETYNYTINGKTKKSPRLFLDSRMMGKRQQPLADKQPSESEGFWVRVSGRPGGITCTQLRDSEWQD